MLLIHYTMDPADTSGKTIRDVSGNGNDGTMSGSPSQSSGIISGSLYFDGTDDYVETGYAHQLEHWTVAVWVKAVSPAGSTIYGDIVSKQSNFIITWDHRESVFRNAAALSVGGTWYPAAFGDLSAGAWHFLAATYDGENLKTYLNGQLVTDNPDPSGNPDLASQPLRVAKHATEAEFFNGYVDELRIFDYAQTPAQIARAFDSYAEDLCSDQDGDRHIIGNSSTFASCGDVCGPNNDQSCLGYNDCDDLDSAINGSAQERCGNSVDDNCNGQIDDGCETTGIHVSSGVLGDNSNTGSIDDPLRTLTFALSVASEGAAILLERGGTWHESVTIPIDNVTIGAYGSGPDPVLDGSIAVGDWSNQGGSVYRASLDETVYALLEDGDWALLAHEPDGDQFRAEGDSHDPLIILGTPAGLSAQDIANSTLVAHPDAWYWLAYPVGGYSAGTITLQDTGRGPSLGATEPYYLMNRLAFLDHANEWYSDGSDIYYRSSDGADPDAHAMRAVTQRLAIYGSGRENVTIQGIEIRNYGSFGVLFRGSSNITIRENSFYHIGSHKYDPIGDTSYQERTNQAVCLNNMGTSASGGGDVSYNTFAHIQGDAIWLQNFDNASITNNVISEVAMHGVAEGAPRTHTPIGGIGIKAHTSDSVQIRNNTLDHIAYSGIAFNGADTIVDSNTIDHSMWALNDGGGIYASWDGWDAGGSNYGSEITNNTIRDVGPRNDVPGARIGIYLDNSAAGILVQDNFVQRAQEGVRLHSSRDCIIDHNEFREVYRGTWLKADWSEIVPDFSRDNVLTNNEFYAANEGVAVATSDYRAGPGQLFGMASAMDYNTYWPNHLSAFILVKGIDDKWVASWESDLVGWQVNTAALYSGALDAHSTAQAP